LKKVDALGTGNTHNLVARGHFSLAHIKLDKNKRMKLNEPQQNRCLFNCMLTSYSCYCVTSYSYLRFQAWLFEACDRARLRTRLDSSRRAF
jgi:hypothetical protein